MNSFWMWFMRPIAEFLGTIALITGLCGVLFVLLAVYNYSYYFTSSKPKNKQ